MRVARDAKESGKIVKTAKMENMKEGCKRRERRRITGEKIRGEEDGEGEELGT